MKKVLSVIAIALLAIANHAIAAITVNIQDSGTNLAVTSSGTLNSLVCTSISGTASAGNGLFPGDPPILAFGDVGSAQDQCVGTTITPATGFGTGGTIANPINSGVSYFFAPSVGFWGPSGWNSGTSLVSSMTFSNTSIASAALTPGTYVYTFANGNATDTLTVNVIAPPPVVPTPALSAWGILILAALMALVGGRRFWRRRESNV